MPTSLGPGRLRFHDHRSVEEQIASGLRIAAWMVGGFVAVVLAGAGLKSFHQRPTLLGTTELVIGTTAMLATTHRWARIIPALPFMQGFLVPWALIEAFISGKNPRAPYQAMPRIETAEFIIGVTLVVALTWRLVRSRPAMTTVVDRVALTCFVLALINQMFVPDPRPGTPPISIVFGFAALSVAWLAYRWDRWKHPHKHHPVAHTSGSTAGTVQGVSGT